MRPSDDTSGQCELGGLFDFKMPPHSFVPGSVMHLKWD